MAEDRADSDAVLETEVGEARLSAGFVALVAHDLRSPLACILGYAALLADPTVQLPEAERLQYCHIIVKQAQFMGSLLDDILTTAQIEAGQMTLMPMPVSLPALLTDLAEESGRRSGRKITLANHVGSVSRGPTVLADGLRLREAFLNLIDNALKYSPPEKPVRLSLRPADLAGWVECEVADEGIGIAEDDLPLLFHRFGRIKNRQTRAVPGSGLGLYITRYIIQQFGGDIRVESAVNQGTRIIVRLPSSDEQGGSQHGKDNPAEHPNRSGG